MLITGAFIKDANAQSTVQNIPWASSRYVPIYSGCRAKPPSDPISQSAFQAMWPSPSFATYNHLLAPIRKKTVESLSAVEAEAYFVLMQGMVLQISFEYAEGDRIRTTVMNDRKRGFAIFKRFNDENFVRCAYLGSELSIMEEFTLQERFSDAERNKARDDYISFVQKALRGEVRSDSYRDVQEYKIGQLYLDQGFDRLPDSDAAAPLFELGSHYLLLAASHPTDNRYISNWDRYAAMLQKLPLKLRYEIGNRLITYVENSRVAKSDQQQISLEVYLHVLNFVGHTALEAKQTKKAVSFFKRQLEIVKELRHKDAEDPNLQVKEAIGFLIIGEAYVLNGERAEAAQAYANAQRSFEAASRDAKEMLNFHDFRNELSERRKELR